MKKYLTAAAALLCATAATPAFAQDQDREFNGFYAGGSIGATFKPGNSDETILFDRDLNGSFGDTVVTTGGADAFSTGFCGGAVGTSPSRPAAGCDSESSAIEFSGRIGFDRQMGGFVLGALVEVGTSDYSSSVTAFSITPASYTFNREVDLLANARIRAGFTATPTTLVYATGGVGYAQMNNSFVTTNTANGVTRDLDDESIGFVLGGGIEQKIGRNFSIGVEYLYQQYDDDSSVRLVNSGTTPATNPFLLGNANGTDFIRSDGKFDMHSVRAVANFRF